MLELDGLHLSIAEVCAVARARTAEVALAGAAVAAMERSRALIDAFAAGEIRFAAPNVTVQLTSAAAG